MKTLLILGLTLCASCLKSSGDTPGADTLPPDVINPALPESAPDPALSLPWLPDLPQVPSPLVLAPYPALAHPPVDTGALISAASKKHRIPRAFIKSIMAAESNFDPSAVSPKGAIGLMQLMPATAQLFGADPAVPEQNVDAGAHYLRVLIDRYHRCRDWLRRVIAAYNAGPGTVDRYRGVPPYPETRTYVARVLGFLKQFRRERG